MGARISWAGPNEACVALSCQLPSVSMLTRESSSASLHSSTIRSTIFWLMLHSLDPLGEGKQGSAMLDPAAARVQKEAEQPGQELVQEEQGSWGVWREVSG